MLDKLLNLLMPQFPHRWVGIMAAPPHWAGVRTEPMGSASSSAWLPAGVMRAVAGINDHEVPNTSVSLQSSEPIGKWVDRNMGCTEEAESQGGEVAFSRSHRKVPRSAPI